MKTITTTELKALVETSDWKHEQELEYVESHIMNDSGKERTYHFGTSKMVSTLGDIKVIRNEGYSYYESEPGTFSGNNEGLSEPWQIEGVKVTDEDGDLLYIRQYCDIFEDNFPSIDYSSVTNSI